MKTQFAFYSAPKPIFSGSEATFDLLVANWEARQGVLTVCKRVFVNNFDFYYVLLNQSNYAVFRAVSDVVELIERDEYNAEWLAYLAN